MKDTNQILPYELREILDGCINGDRASQSSLYHLYADKMMSVCSWYAHNREEAEEILQDGFMRIFTYLPKYRGEGSFEGWVRKIMVNAALLKYRNKSSKMYIVKEYIPEIHSASEEAGFITNYDEKELVKMVQHLPPACRLVFNLHVFEGFNHSEISKSLGISKGTSKSNLADARRILKIALAGKNKITSQ